MAKELDIFWSSYHSTYLSLLPNLEELGILTYLKSPNMILEIGFGKGRNLKFLHKLGYNNIVGIDISSASFSCLENINDDIILIRSDGSYMPFKNRQFNTILLMGVLSTINNFEARDRLLFEIERVCKDNGLIVFTDYVYDFQREKEYKQNEIIFNYRGMFKPKWSNIPFIHYPYKILTELFGPYYILYQNEVHLYSCRNNINAGICLLLKKV